ncbi:C40 family peptidase [Nocardioides pakistanensis]
MPPSHPLAHRIHLALRAALTVALSAALVLTACASGTTEAPPASHATATSSTAASATPSTAAPSTTTPPAARTRRAPGLRAGRDAWVAVSVTTLWRSPESPRAVDAPALERPARIDAWLSGMSTAERRALNGRADTQALLGDRVRVLRLRPGWAKVVVPSQPSQKDRRGYPGWVPRRQLTAQQPTASARRATVVKRTAWLRTDQQDSRRVLKISYGTRFPVVTERPRFVRVVDPTGKVRRLARSVVRVHDTGEPAIAPSRRSIVRVAKSFLGLDYLWSGLTGFGLDCSGLTWLTYRVHGIRIPRDALPQSQSGMPVRPLRKGDLLFYATDGLVHHVTMFVGDGQMIEAPGTGKQVRIIPTSTPSYRAEYAGARRYLR